MSPKKPDRITVMASAVGGALADHPWAFITVSVAVSLVLAAGLSRIQVETDIRVSFSPQHSDSYREMTDYLEFYNLTGFPQRTFVHFSALDGGDMLREETLQEVESLDARFTAFLTRPDAATGKRPCDPICTMNVPFHYFVKELRAYRNGSTTKRLFDHPSSKLNGHELFVALTLFGVERNESAETMRIQSVKSVVLWYFARADSKELRQSYKEFSLQMFEDAKHHKPNQLVQADIFGDVIANHEMIRGAFEATRMMLLGFALLIIFITLVLWPDWSVRQLPTLVASAVLTPLLASAASFGVLSWFGVSTYSIQCVAPFLALGIGVDDAFILFHWWHTMKEVADLRERSKIVFSQISASITITSATNIVAFFIGFFTPTPQMSIFCLCTSLSLFFDYILTYTVLGPVVYLLSTNYTEAATDAPPDVVSVEGSSSAESRATDEDTAMVALRLPAPPTEEKRPLSSSYGSIHAMHSRVFAVYADFITSIPGYLTCFGVVVCLFAVCTLGVFRMKASFEPSKAFPSDSPLATSLQRIKPVFNETFPVSVYVRNLPDVGDAEQYSKFEQMLLELESIDGVYGRDRTLLFLKEYEKYDRAVDSTLRSIFFLANDESPYKMSLKNLPSFLALLDNPATIQYEKPTNGSDGRLVRFQMAVTAQGMSEWANRAQLIDSARKVIKRYPSLNATLFDGDSAVLHLLLTVGQDLIGSILVTVISMAIVCWLFVWNFHAVVVISSIITSICYCLVGVLSWWGADLDPVTQVDVLLATGFSVDYTAHIAFQFCRATGTPKERVSTALDEMSAPLLQAGISTLLCMLPLIFVKTYAILAFAKTIFAVVFLGLVHGLFILPVMLMLYPPKTISK